MRLSSTQKEELPLKILIFHALRIQRRDEEARGEIVVYVGGNLYLRIHLPAIFDMDVKPGRQRPVPTQGNERTSVQ